MPDEKQDEQMAAEQAKEKPVDAETSGAGYGNNAGPQDEVEER